MKSKLSENLVIRLKTASKQLDMSRAVDQFLSYIQPQHYQKVGVPYRAEWTLNDWFYLTCHCRHCHHDEKIRTKHLNGMRLIQCDKCGTFSYFSWKSINEKTI